MRVVVQARMGSSRLPGKIMAPLAGRPLLWHVVQRLQAAGHGDNVPWEVMVATTTDRQDDLTAAWCREHGIACRRGSSDDVLARYLLACEDLGDDDVLLRATADNPLYCPRRTAGIVTEHCNGRADYTCIRELSYVVPEVMQVGALRRMTARVTDPYCREHVTPWFRQRRREFRTQFLPAHWQGLRADMRLTVDTPEELARMQWIFACCGVGESPFPLEAVYELLSAATAMLDSTCPAQASPPRLPAGPQALSVVVP